MSPGKRARGPEVVRRSRTPRLDVTTVLAVVIPLLTVGLLALVRIPPVHDTDQPPSLTKLTNALVVCPSGPPRLARRGRLDGVAGRPATCRWSRRASSSRSR